MKGKGIWIFLGIVVIAVIWFVGRYNKIVLLDEEVEGKWAQVEAAYQRRADLIPNLVNTVKGYADFEQETLTQVIEARSKATSIQVDPSNLSPEAIANFQQAQDGLSGALSRLLVTIERYPDLKANQNFRDLQAELTNTENKINFERNNFNESVKAYNGTIRRVPGNLIAGISGFDRRGYFESAQGTETAPAVEF
jgi:LemA protein